MTAILLNSVQLHSLLLSVTEVRLDRAEMINHTLKFYQLKAQVQLSLVFGIGVRTLRDTDTRSSNKLMKN